MSNRFKQTTVNETPLNELNLMEELMLLGIKDKEGYVSIWNDSLSYVLRGCILAELALRQRIKVCSSVQKSTLLCNRPIIVCDCLKTGEFLLDEAIRLMHQHKKWATSTWMDLLSGDTWNFLNVSYQMRQVRERISKGLVDKGILRNDKLTILGFDIAIHPLNDNLTKRSLCNRLINTLLLPSDSAAWKQVSLKTIILICAASAGNVLENALLSLTFSERQQCLKTALDLTYEFSTWDDKITGPQKIKNIELNEVICAIIQVFSKMDSF